MADILLFRWKKSTEKWKSGAEIWPFRACALKIDNIILIYGAIAEILTHYKKSRSRNTMLTSYFRPEVEILQLRACAVKVRYISLVIGTIWSLCSCYDAGITFHRMFIVRWKISWKWSQIAEISAFKRKSGLGNPAWMCDFFIGAA